MSEEIIRKALRNFGLTDKETDVYVFLAKHGVTKGGDITRQTKTDKALVYRTLKSLEARGFVESTLEFPARFTAVPFENVIDLSIRAKQDEAAQIKEKKMELLNYWQKIEKPGPQHPLEKFTVIEGSTKIYHKLSQMMRETRNHLLAVTTAQGLARADQLGLFDIGFDHPLKSKVTLRFLAPLSSQNVKATKEILNTLTAAKFNFEGRTPELGTSLPPQMAIRDQEEVLFFITPRAEKPSARQDDMCLWTNCKSLVDAFASVFEELWRNSVDLKEKIAEIETGKRALKTVIIEDAAVAEKKYNETVKSAEEEIFIMTSSKDLVELWKNTLPLNERIKQGVDVKIMAPIVGANVEAARQLSKLCAVKHVPPNYLQTTVVDGKHLFQFKRSTQEKQPLDSSRQFEDTLYTNNPGYVQKTKAMLNELWKNGHQPLGDNLESIFGTGIRSQCAAYFPGAISGTGPDGTFYPLPPSDLAKKDDYTVAEIIDEDPSGKLTEQDVLNAIVDAQKDPPEKKALRIYSSQAMAVFHLPDFFNLPSMLIRLHHIEKSSLWGEEDAVLINLWLETPTGHAYVPVAVLSDSVKAQAYWKASFSASPAGRNVQLAEENGLQIRVHGNTMFAGWTVPIPLFPSQYILPPACISIEGYGDVKTAAYTIDGSMCRFTARQNGFDAFVTFMHSSSKYSGPGTDGFLVRDFMADIAPDTVTRTRPTFKHHIIEKRREEIS